jgi:hypothetical protein
MHRGVFFVGAGDIPCRSRLRAATYRSGFASQVSGIGALYLARATDREPAVIDLLTTTGARDFDGVRVERTTSLPDCDRCDYDGIRSVSVARALVDLSRHHPAKRLVRWMRNAEFHGTLDMADVVAAEIRLARRGDTAAIRTAFDDYLDDCGGTDSALEDRLLELIVGAGLPNVRVGQLMPGVLRPDERVDLFFAQYGLVVEADGPHHRKPLQRANDRRRDRQLRAAGFQVLRLWWWEIEQDPAGCLDRIRRALAA